MASTFVRAARRPVWARESWASVRAINSLRADLATLAQISLARLLVALAVRFLPARTLPRLRAHLYRLAGARIERRAAVLGTIHLIGARDTMFRNVRIGAGAVIGESCLFIADAEITIGANTAIGPTTRLITAFHDVGPPSQRMDLRPRGAPISIGPGCFLGAGVTVLPGVVVGGGTIIGAGSVVTKDLPENVLAAGNPARVIRPLPAERAPRGE